MGRHWGVWLGVSCTCMCHTKGSRYVRTQTKTHTPANTHMDAPRPTPSHIGQVRTWGQHTETPQFFLAPPKWGIVSLHRCGNKDRSSAPHRPLSLHPI